MEKTEFQSIFNCEYYDDVFVLVFHRQAIWIEWNPRNRELCDTKTRMFRKIATNCEVRG